MADNSPIEWTGSTWNPTTGCTEISDECLNCYARTLHEGRLQKMGLPKYSQPFHTIVCHEDELETPLHWKKPRKIFVNSMSDLFHKDIPYEFIEKVFATMMKANWHIYQILTKRPERMELFIEAWLKNNYLTKVPEHIWLGVSCGRDVWTTRINYLRIIQASVRFVSFEPLLEEVKPDLTNIHWAIVGGESGKNHRPIKKEWVLTIKEACAKYNTKFFFKQWGGRTSKSNGRLLDGQEYNEYPLIQIRHTKQQNRL